MIEPCTDPTCDCLDHISSASHVPCCPVHNAPLVLADRDGYGQCIMRDHSSTRPHVGGQQFVSVTCRTWREADWRWLPRTLFQGEDVPPMNGWQPPKYKKDAKRFRLDVVRTCKDCEQDTPHLDAGHTAICLRCGYGSWIA